jgi:hypothetical protein
MLATTNTSNTGSSVHLGSRELILSETPRHNGFANRASCGSETRTQH